MRPEGGEKRYMIPSWGGESGTGARTTTSMGLRRLLVRGGGNLWVMKPGDGQMRYMNATGLMYRSTRDHKTASHTNDTLSFMRKSPARVEVSRVYP